MVIDTEYYDIEKPEDQEEVKTLIANFIENISNKWCLVFIYSPYSIIPIGIWLWYDIING